MYVITLCLARPRTREKIPDLATMEFREGPGGSAPMSHSVPTASTAATYLVSLPRRRTFTCAACQKGIP